MNTANQILCVAASLLALSAAPLHAQTNCSPPPSGLVAWWPAEGNYNDFVGTNDGTLVGSASYVTGNVGSAWNLPGNGYITVPSAANLRPPQFTIECWIKPANTGRPRYTADVDTIVQTYSGSAGFWLGLCWDTNYTYLGFSSKVPQGTIAFYVWITGAGFTLLYAPPVPADGLFHHVAASVDDSSMNIYLDGALAATRARPAGAVVHSTRPFSIGRADDAAMDRQAAAAIDELSFYNRTLSPVELASIFTAGSAGKCSSGPPNIVLQPQSQNVVWSQSATFTVGATGTKPFAYQWQFQNTNLPAATNAALVLPAVSTNQAGNYRVIITNSLGSVTSAVAVLTGSLSAGYWTGGGDGASWNVAANWSGGVVPGPTNDVIITDGAGTNVVISSGSITVKSIQCSKAFTISGGSLTVTTNNSLLSGTLTLVSGTALSATGFAAVLVATGKATADGANLYASGGATLSLPGLTSYDAPDVGYATYRLRASGAGSVLSLPNLTNVIGNSSYSGYVIVEALAGGLVNLSNVVAISQPCLLDGNQNSYARGVQVLADGTNSVVDLSALVSFVDVAPLHASRLEARTGGTIWMGKAASMDGVEVRLDGTGLDEPLLGSFTRGALSVTGAAVDWSGATNFTGSALSVGSGGSVNLSNLVDLRNGAVTLSGGGTANLTGVRLLDGASLIVSNGVTLSLPGVTSYDAPDVGYATYRLRASGAGSVLSLPNLTNVIGNASYSGYLIVEAPGGGLVNLSNVVAISQPCLLDGNQNYYARGVQVLAEGTNSVVDLRALVSFVDVAPLHASRLEARIGGTIWMGKTASLDGVEVRLNATGSLGLPALRSYTRGALSVNGQAVDWSGATNFTGSALSVGSGGSVNLSNLVDLRNGAVTLSGGGTANLSGVQLLDGANLIVSNGVTLSLPGVTSYDAPDVGYATYRLRASGAGSVLSLPNLTNVIGNASYSGYLIVEALGGGLVNLSNVVAISQPCLLDGNQNYYARGVQVLAEGTNSVVDLRALVSFVDVAPLHASRLEARTGGTIWMGKTASLDGVEVRLNATGSLGLPALRSYTRGSLSVNGQAVDWNGVTNFNGSVLSVGSGGSVNLSGVTTFSSGALTVDGGGSVNLSNVVDLRLTTVVLGAGAVTPDLGRVRMLDGANLTVSNGVTLSLPMVTSYDAPDVGATTNRLRASGAGSVLSLPNVANVVGNNQYLGYLMVEALAGGQVNLSNMVTITQPCLFDGNVNYARGVQVLADGINSVVDLRSLSGLISLAPNSASSLTAQNGGVILLNDRAFLLSNVAINIPPGNPVLPPTLVVSSTLNLYGKAWHSYWVEQRDTRFADSPWVFTARVPLTNAFQAFASAPPANTAYRVSEFVADPAILDLNRVSKTNVQMVLYGALSKSFEVQTTNSFDRLPPAWSTWATTGAMTNSFRIFPPFTPSGPQRFYRGKEL